MQKLEWKLDISQINWSDAQPKEGKNTSSLFTNNNEQHCSEMLKKDRINDFKFSIRQTDKVKATCCLFLLSCGFFCLLLSVCCEAGWNLHPLFFIIFILIFIFFHSYFVLFLDLLGVNCDIHICAQQKHMTSTFHISNHTEGPDLNSP